MKKLLFLLLSCIQLAAFSQSIDLIIDSKIKASEAKQKAYADSLFKVKSDGGGTQNPPTDTRKACAEIGRDPKIISISEIKSNSLSLQFDANNVFELEYEVWGTGTEPLYKGTRKPSSSRIDLSYPAQPNGSYTLKIRGYSCKSPDDPKGFEIKTDQGGNNPDPGSEPGSGNPPPVDGKYTYHLVMGTTGDGFDPDAQYGIKSEWVSRIEATKLNDGTYGISDVCVWIPWEKYERRGEPGRYQEEAARKIIQYCRERDLGLSAVFMRRRDQNDNFILPSEYIVGSGGTTYFEGCCGTGKVYAGYANDRVNALSDGAIRSLARVMATYDKSFYIALAGGGAGEQVNYVLNGKDFREAGDFSEDNLARFWKWASARAIVKRTSGSIPMIQGQWNDWPHPDFNDPDSVGIEFARFTTYGIKKAFDSFADAVHNETDKLVATYFYSVTSNLQFRSIANPNLNYVAAKADAWYGSDGDGLNDQYAKDKVNSLNIGNGKISMAEQDPDDVSTYNGPQATPPYDNGNLRYDIFESTTRRLFDRGLMAMNLAMSWGENELKAMHPTFERLRKDYVGHAFKWPVVNASNTVTVDVTDKYRQSIDLMQDITATDTYTRYTDKNFFGSKSPEVGDGGGNPGPQPSKDYSPVKSILEANAANYNWSYVFELKSPSQTLYSLQVGQYDKNSRLKVMSHSKFTTGVIIAYLIDKGKLSLDTRVSDVIRSWDRPDKAGITIRQIMGHTSGIPDDQSNEGAKTLEEHVNWIAGLGLEFTPGSQFKYSTVSYQVIARMAELVTGKKWKDLFREILVDPCEMGQAEYNPVGAGDVKGNPNNPLAGYGLICSENEWMNFISMIRDGGVFKGRRVLNAGVFDILKTRTSPGWSDWGCGVMFTDGQYVSEAASGIGSAIFPFKYAWTIFTQSSYENTYWPNRQVREKTLEIYQAP